MLLGRRPLLPGSVGLGLGLDPLPLSLYRLLLGGEFRVASRPLPLAGLVTMRGGRVAPLLDLTLLAACVCNHAGNQRDDDDDDCDDDDCGHADSPSSSTRRLHYPQRTDLNPREG